MPNEDILTPPNESQAQWEEMTPEEWLWLGETPREISWPKDLLLSILPDGTEQRYERSKKWGRKRWAWEFLCRNEKFQAACEEVRMIVDDEDRETAEIRIAGQFGLKDFKSWTTKYTDHKPRFVGFVSSLPSLDIFRERNQGAYAESFFSSTRMAATSVLMKFDLLPIRLADKSATDAQLKSALRQIKKYLTVLREISPGGRQTKEALTTVQLCRHLRVHDLHTNGMNDDAICLLIRGESRDRGTPEQRRKAGLELVTAAKRLVDCDYILIAMLKIKQTVLPGA